MPVNIKPLVWIGGSKKDLLAMPEDVQDFFGFALHEAQAGKKSDHAKPLKGFGSAGVLEISEDWNGDAYRAVYTVKFRAHVYVLHCFQKNPPSASPHQNRISTKSRPASRKRKPMQRSVSHDRN